MCNFKSVITCDMSNLTAFTIATISYLHLGMNRFIKTYKDFLTNL